MPYDEQTINYLTRSSQNVWTYLVETGVLPTTRNWVWASRAEAQQFQSHKFTHVCLFSWGSEQRRWEPVNWHDWHWCASSPAEVEFRCGGRMHTSSNQESSYVRLFAGGHRKRWCKYVTQWYLLLTYMIETEVLPTSRNGVWASREKAQHFQSGK